MPDRLLAFIPNRETRLVQYLFGTTSRSDHWGLREHPWTKWSVAGDMISLGM